MSPSPLALSVFSLREDYLSLKRVQASARLEAFSLAAPPSPSPFKSAFTVMSVDAQIIQLPVFCLGRVHSHADYYNNRVRLQKPGCCGYLSQLSSQPCDQRFHNRVFGHYRVFCQQRQHKDREIHNCCCIWFFLLRHL